MCVCSEVPEELVGDEELLYGEALRALGHMAPPVHRSIRIHPQHLCSQFQAGTQS